MVCRVEAQEPSQRCCRGLAAIDTQTRTRKSLQTAEKGSIVDEAPGQHAVEILTHAERADGCAQLEAVKRERRPAREIAFAEQGVRVETTKVDREPRRQVARRPARGDPG